MKITEPETAQEQALLSRARVGDMEAFGELCRAHESRLLRHAMALGCPLAAAEDLVQEALVEAWKNLRRYDGSCRYSTWLCAILLNRHRKLLRRKQPLWFLSWHRDTGELDADLERITAGDLAPDETAQRRDEARLVRNCLAALPRKQQQVIYLRFYAGDSLEGIAAALGCSVGTVKSRLFHALEKLRRMKALRPPAEVAGLDSHACTVPGNLLLTP